MGFATRVLGITPLDHQAAILNSVRDNRRTMVISCNSIGKDFIAAAACHWWLGIWAEALVITTAVTGEQVKNIQWKEIRHMWRNSALPLGGHMPAVMPEYRVDSKRGAIGISTRDEPERLQGHHEANILVIITEATGVADGVWDGLRTVMASGNARILALTNPTRATGEVYDAATGQREGWNIITVGAFDMPNLQACQALGPDHMAGHGVPERCPNPYPFLITHLFERELAQDFGIESDYYRVHILGQFPSAASDALIPLDWVEAAFQRKGTPSRVVCGGLDVARMGTDRTAYAELVGSQVYRLEEWPRQELTETEGLMRRGVLADEPDKRVCIDDTGLGGGVAPRLEEDYGGVRGVDFGSAADDPAKFANKVSEMWWHLRQRLDPESEEPLGLPGQHPLRRRITAQLAGAIYKLDSKGRIRVDKKGGSNDSPDVGDAIILALEAQSSRLDRWVLA